MKTGTIITRLCVLLLVALGFCLRAVHFAFFYQVFPEESTCDDIPKGSIVLALGFEYQGEDESGIQPGAGNVLLADKLASCAGRLSLVVVQKAISDALKQNGQMKDGKLLGTVPLIHMHAHDPKVKVRTFAALEMALTKLAPLPGSIILLAHDKQIERAAMDLQVLYPADILLWKINGVPYVEQNRSDALVWAFRELYLARPMDTLQCLITRMARRLS
jgi:hypothetical protein